MELLIKKSIEVEAKKRLARYSRSQYYIHKYRSSFLKRTGETAAKAPDSIPKQWLFHKHFDPRYCLNHSAFIAGGIWKSLRLEEYETVPALRSKIPKPSGGFRCIDAFSVPDAAIAKIFLENLRARNAKIFSDSSYAYQNDKTPLDAILRIRSYLDAQTIFVSQYDFSKYFDSIRHDFIEKIIDRSGPFLTTYMERAVLRAVMAHTYIEDGGAIQKRVLGVPQGNSLSLFLANAAAHPLDTELARLSGVFARFADDSVIVNYSYEDALKCADAVQRFSMVSGIGINHDKSNGIRIFSNDKVEMTSIRQFEFLGYQFRRSDIKMGDRAIKTIKKRCAKIIYNHLLLYPRRVNKFSSSRLGSGYRDWDLVTCVNELRSYMYGGRSQDSLENYLQGLEDIRNFSGAVSYFCLIEDGEIFRQLDGWLSSSLFRAYSARILLLKKLSGKNYKKISEHKIISGEWYKFKKIEIEAKLPSFFTAWRAARKSWGRHGLGGVDVHGEGYAY